MLPLHQENSPSLKVQVLYMSLMVDEDLKNEKYKNLYFLKENVLEAKTFFFLFRLLSSNPNDSEGLYTLPIFSEITEKC